jgi:simple sugar transport system ATP-binding protein
MDKRSKVLLKAVNIHKSFRHIQALRGINLEIKDNEIIGLVGDNGAGKSTLIKVLNGVHKPDRGELYWQGKKLEDFSASMARDLGIITVFQDRALVEQHPVWRNIFMGRELTNRWGLTNIKKEKEETRRLMGEMMGFTSSAILPVTIVGAMSGGEQQGVAISRALYFKAELIILDEPTTGLSLSEAQKVLIYVEEIKKKGKSCIFITHNLFHVYPVSDRIVILDRGKLVGDFRGDQISLEQLDHKMRLVAVTGSINGEGKTSDVSFKDLRSRMP